MLDYVKTVLALRGISLLNDRRGVTAVEYALIAALIAAAIIAGVTALGGTIAGKFNTINAAM